MDEHHADRKSKKRLVTGIGAGALALAAIGAIIGLIVVYTGAYNVAATEEHASFTRWALDTTYHSSVKSRAAGIDTPPDLESRVERGATEYQEMCQHCHGGPGVDRAEWASGLRPRPPHLTEAAAEWEPREVFWLIKHGVKMSAMPAFGPTHDDETLWNIVAFVNALPALTPERYAALGREGAPGERNHHSDH